MANRMRADRSWGWQFDGACRGGDATLFFAPTYFEKREQKNVREAKAKSYCRRCSVRDDCLEYALGIHEPHGIWGGLNESERRQLLRERGLRVK